MPDILSERHERVFVITLNRVSKHNAFDDVLLNDLLRLLDEVQHDPKIRVILLNANGQHFSAGADLAWMKRMSAFSEEQNLADANILSRVMYTLYHMPKPTVVMVQGSAFGGGAGLIAACDIAIASPNARFCFSEVKLGLIPAVISPYVIKAVGERTAAALFMSAETFDAKRALALKLIHLCVPEEELFAYTLNYAKQISNLAPLAVNAAKTLVRQVAAMPINEELQHITADLIAKKRVSDEGQRGIQAFLNKETPNWNE